MTMPLCIFFLVLKLVDTIRTYEGFDTATLFISRTKRLCIFLECKYIISYGVLRLCHFSLRAIEFKSTSISILEILFT